MLLFERALLGLLCATAPALCPDFSASVLTDPARRTPGAKALAAESSANTTAAHATNRKAMRENEKVKLSARVSQRLSRSRLLAIRLGLVGLDLVDLLT